MANIKTVGSIARLWRFPVKSMRGERLKQTELTDQGLLGDRAYALIDMEANKVISAKNVTQFLDLFACEAAFVESPQPGQEIPPVRIRLPNGTSVRSDSRDVNQVLSAFFKRDVRLMRAEPGNFAISQHSVEQKLGTAFGSFHDAFQMSVLTTSTLRQLSECRPQSLFDERRFRMNVIVDTDERGFVENRWVGYEVGFGETTRLKVAMPDARCVMTTLAQEELPNDSEVLRTLVQHNRIQVGDAGQFPCAGVYAVVVATGSVRLGDRVSLRL